jgi:uncharacterized protein (TIGR00730 family)
MFRRICVFCGARDGIRAEYPASAEDMGRVLLARKIGLVYGGGGVGLMGRVAQTVKSGGGEVIGVIPRALLERESARSDLSDLRIVRSMHERKALMAEISDGFVALPGGLGTFEELCEILTWAQLGLHAKPIGLLNVASYFDPLIQLFDHAVSEGFVDLESRGILRYDTSPERLLTLMEACTQPQVAQWIDPDES